MPPAADPCGPIWIKKLLRVLKSQKKPWIFKIRGFLVLDLRLSRNCICQIQIGRSLRKKSGDIKET